MRFYNWINDDLDNLFAQGLEELKKQEVKEEIIQLTEEQKQQLDEAVISVTFIISLILAAPSIMKGITKALGWVYKKIKKLFGGKEQSSVEDKLVEMIEKWHHSYIVVLRQILRTGGIFKAAGITDKEKQTKATEVVFYTIILGFAIYGGITTASSIINMIKHSSLSHGHITAAEAALTGIKSKEVKSFLAQLGA